MARAEVSDNAFGTEVRLLFQSALVVFVVTVVIGILNGVDAVDFGRRALLTHVHMGTLGWLTLGVMGASLMLYGTGGGLTPRSTAVARWSARAAVVAIPVFALTFLFTEDIARPAFGALAGLAIAAFFAWVVSRARVVTMTVPRLALMAALCTAAVGAVLGVLLGLEMAGTIDFMPSGTSDAHPATMVVGFLIPVGMALSEWGLVGDTGERATRLGRWQVLLPFSGGVSLLLGSLFDIIPLVILSLPCEVAGAVILTWRMWPHLRRVDLLRASRQRFSALAIPFMDATMVMFIYLIVRYKGDFDNVPTNELLTLDHLTFVGVMTNAAFALVCGLPAVRNRLPYADDILFWGMNVGVTGFMVGLLADYNPIKWVFTPILGAGILVGIAANTLALQGGLAPRPSVPEPEAAAGG